MDLLHSIQSALPVREPVLVFTLVMWTILVAPMLARRLRMPEIIGLILAGIAIGENGLNILARDETMVLLGTVGLLYIMFLAGLEVDLHQFIQKRKHSLIFGLLTFSIPMAIGTIVALHVLGFSWPAAILLASMFASHTLVAYPVITRLGITRNQAVTASIGGTIITDTLALLVLAVIAAAATGHLSTWFWIKTGGAISIFVLLVMTGIPPLARFYFHKHSDHGVRDFIFVIATGFLAAFLALAAGVEAIIGAFLGGLALNRSIPAQSPLMARVHFAGNAIFIPFFLISVGMLVNVRVFLSPGSGYVWLVGGAMVVTVVLTKWLAAWAAQRLLGFTREEGRIMFGLSVTQAAATLAAVFVGYRIGLFGEEVLNGAIMMILVTCVIGPSVVDRYGRVVALREDMEPLKPGDTPLRILLPLANPGSVPLLMDLACMIRRPHSPEPLYPLTVADQTGDVPRQVAASERMLSHAVLYASGAGVPVQPVTRVDSNIASGILRAITELRISTVIIGWTGTASRKRPGMGAVFDQLLRESGQSILVCRIKTAINTTRRIRLIIPPLVERERGFGEAVRTIKQMAIRLGAKLDVLVVERERSHMKTHFSRVKPFPPTEFHSVATDALFEGDADQPNGAPDNEDLIVLLGAREGRLAWTPAMSELPLKLSARYPGVNLVIFHPPEDDIEPAAASGPASLLDPARVFPDLPPLSFDGAMEHMLAQRFPDAMHRRSILDQLSRMIQEYPVEMAPGIIMVHAHVDHIPYPLLFVGSSRNGFFMPIETQQPARVLVILLSPTNLPAEEHLRSLALIARMLRGPGRAERISRATTFDELRDELMQEK